MPTEDAKEGYCAKLKKWLYGMRGAARGWGYEHTAKMKGVGFIAGEYAPTVFAHRTPDLRYVVRGDGFTFAGVHADLEWAAGEMQGWHEVRSEGFWGKMVILNRKVSW